MIRIKRLSVYMAMVVLAGAPCARAEKAAFTAAFQDLAKDDQVEFVRAVNSSMEDYKSSSPKRRLQTIYAFNRDAVKSSPAKERKAVIAEVFATVPFDALPRITDGFAEDLFNRKAAGFSDKDDSFVEFAAATLMHVRIRLEQMPADLNPGARSAFAVICFLKASGGQPPELKDSFLFYVLTGSHEISRKTWIPAALGQDGKEPSYQPILEAGYKGEEPEHQNLHPLAAFQRTVLLHSDARIMEAKDVSGVKTYDSARGVMGTGAGGGSDLGVTRVPRGAIENKDSPWYRRRRGSDPGGESDGYMGQGL